MRGGGIDAGHAITRSGTGEQPDEFAQGVIPHAAAACGLGG